MTPFVKRSICVGMMVVALGSMAAGQQDVLLDDHFDNNDLATDVNGVNGGFQVVDNFWLGVGTDIESGTLATFATDQSLNSNTGIESLHTFDAANMPGFTVTWVVDSADIPEVNGLSFGADSDTGLWGDSVYLRFGAGGNALMSAQAGGAMVTVEVANGIILSELTDGFTLSLTFDDTGVSWSQTGIDSFAATGSRTWDELNGEQAFGYSDVFGPEVRVSAWNQTIDTIPNSMSIDRVTVTREP
jgi:hypothetical protein